MKSMEVQAPYVLARPIEPRIGPGLWTSRDKGQIQLLFAAWDLMAFASTARVNPRAEGGLPDRTGVGSRTFRLSTHAPASAGRARRPL